MTPTEGCGRHRGTEWARVEKLSQERVRVQAEGEMNPMTLLGSQRAAPSAPRIATAAQIQCVHWVRLS